jgi:biopolymer transport protein ExbD
LKFKRTLVADDEAVPMSSMADIAFLLIIFFMLTTVFSVDQGIIIELPETSQRESIDLREIVLVIDAQGIVHSDGKVVAMGSVGDLIKSRRLSNPKRPVVVRSDKNVNYGVVADVMDELLSAGVRDVALPTVAEGGKE